MKADLNLVSSYSEALFEAAKKAGVLDKVAADAKMLHGIVEGQVKLRTLMEAPNIPRDTKEQVITRVFGSRIHPLLLNFTLLLLRRGRLELWVPAVVAFAEWYAKHMGVTPASVTTAVELDPGDKARLEKVLSDYTQKTLVITWKVDDRLIGGVRFQSGDLLVDSSLASGLGSLKETLMHTQVAH